MSEVNERTRDLSPHEPSRWKRMRKLLEDGFVKYPKPLPPPTGIERMDVELDNVLTKVYEESYKPKPRTRSTRPTHTV